MKINIINNNDNNIFNNFDIKLKEPINSLDVDISCNFIAYSTLLKDGRFATDSNENKIVIFNIKSFKPDLIIKEHSDQLTSLIELSSGILASSSLDNTIKLFNITGNEYKVIQTLNYHKGSVNKIIELSNKKLVSCSDDKFIIFYLKDNNEYKIDFKISTNNKCNYIVQTKENEICYFESIADHNIPNFFDLIERKNIIKIDNINYCGLNSVKMITKDLLLIGGEGLLYIVNVNTHNLIRTINIPDSRGFNDICVLNKNMFLTCDDGIKQWKIEGDNIILISEKKKAHGGCYLLTLLKFPDGHIISGDGHGLILFW